SNNSSYFSYPVSVAVSGILRRLSSEPTGSLLRGGSPKHSSHKSSNVDDAGMNGAFYTPPRRTASPFQPPPLTALSLEGYKYNTTESAKLLTKALAEEIRLLVPPRNQLVDRWQLVYSLDQDGSSLATLYKRADDFRGKRGGFVLVVRDGSGNASCLNAHISVFGSYLSDAPRPAPHFFGNGECFLWRASILSSMPTLASLPPPPSEDTTNAQRMTTISQPKRSGLQAPSESGRDVRSGTATPDTIRFKAFPYSGENDFLIYCEAGYLSIGGGDGHYGLWLGDGLERGISSSCPTFGNEPLSDEGTKFEVLGVELWFIGS
ncbi:TLD-domain-containing protein, partial [Rhizodiscina lignyota]